MEPVKIGEIIGDLKCVEILPDDIKHRKYVRMQCLKCGREKRMAASDVRHSKGIYHLSCGQGEKSKDAAFYTKWRLMRARTNPSNKNTNNKCYREGNINSDAFAAFVDFYDAMYDSYIKHVEVYGQKNTTLDRIDPKKNYTPENCRWATLQEQAENSSKVKPYEAISPEGDVIVSKNCRTFCFEHNLFPSDVCKVLKGTKKDVHGWKFRYLPCIPKSVTTIP